MKNSNKWLSDAISVIRKELASQQKELEDWKEISIKTDF